MDMNLRRRYVMDARADTVDSTRRSILEAAFALSRERFTWEIVLADVAERAGVAVKTVLRHFKSREGLFAAVNQYAREQIVDERVTPVGDVGNAVSAILDHYEARGDWVLRLLCQESSNDFARDSMTTGRKVHREWVQTTFAPQLDHLEAPAREETVDLLVVATDLYTWKLLRRDRGLTRPEVEARIRHLVNATLAQPH
jgi:AcrR family transcriptional regulator